MNMLEHAIVNLRVAVVYESDGAPADALRAVLRAEENLASAKLELFELIARRYIPGATPAATEKSDKPKRKTPA